MPVTPWASDTTYVGSPSLGADQSTKIAPLTGEKAQGLIPDRHIPVQWLNYALNELGVLANTNEADIDVLEALSRTLQAAYDESETQLDTDPHIDVGTGELRIGGSAGSQILRVLGTGVVQALQGLYVEGGLDVGDGDIDGAFALNITGLSTLSGGADVSGTLESLVAFLSSGTATFDGTATFNDAVTVAAALSATDTVTVTNLLRALSTFQADGAATFGSTATVAGTTTLNGALDANDDVNLGALDQFVIDDTTGKLTLDIQNLEFGNATSGQRAIIHNGSGVAGQIRLESNEWTPSAAAVTGTGAATSDLATTRGFWQRVSDIVHFTMVGELDTSGWSAGAYTIDVALPISTTANDVRAAIASVTEHGGALLGDFYAQAVTGTDKLRIHIPSFSAGSSAVVSISGNYSLE